MKPEGMSYTKVSNMIDGGRNKTPGVVYFLPRGLRLMLRVHYTICKLMKLEGMAYTIGVILIL